MTYEKPITVLFCVFFLVIYFLNKSYIHLLGKRANRYTTEPQSRTHKVVVRYLCHCPQQLAHAGCMMVSCLGAVGSGWGWFWEEQGGWVGQEWHSWKVEAQLEPEGTWSEEKNEFALMEWSDESLCVSHVHACVWVSFLPSYTGGVVVDRALYVSHGLQDVEGDEADLVKPIATLPPALGWLDHLSDREGCGQGEGCKVYQQLQIAFVKQRITGLLWWFLECAIKWLASLCVTSSVSPCCTESSLLFLAMKS